jgi:hypothetical protein
MKGEVDQLHKKISLGLRHGFSELRPRLTLSHPTENILYLTIVYYAKMNIVNYSEFGQFTIVMSIVPYSRTMLDYGNF